MTANMKAVKPIKKSSDKSLRTKFKISFGLFILAKKLKNNFIAYYLLLSKASPKKLEPYYHTFIYALIRQMAWSIIGVKKLIRRLNIRRFELNRAQAVGVWPKITKRGISAALIIGIIFVQVMNVGAFEAHLVKVTAKIVNDIPLADPPGGEFCLASSTPVSLTTTLTDPLALIIYTTDLSDPVCGLNGTIYSGPIIIATTTTLKAATCHDSKQSAIAKWIYNFNIESCGYACGNYITEPGETCDDGNSLDGDGCSSSCQIEQTSAPEICDGLDNDLNGTIDDVYETRIATSSPSLTRLGDLTNVTASTTLSDNIYAIQSATSTDYIYLNWVFPQIATTSAIASSTLNLEHQEANALIAVQWWDGASYQEVCDPPEWGSDTIDSCDLSGFITLASQVQNLAIRLKVDRIADPATGYLDWADMEIKYVQKVDCGLILCGNGAIDPDESCDDGNTLNQDGCSSSCQVEPARSCVKINEVYYNVDADHGDDGQKKDEWVELYNACNFSIDIKDWTIGDDSGGSSISSAEKILGSHVFAVLAFSSQTWGYWNIPPDALKIPIGAPGIGNGLGNDGDRVILRDADNIISDQMSYGTDTTVFSLPEPAPATAEGRSIARIVKGIDTDTAADWAYLANPNPGTNPHGQIEIDQKINQGNHFGNDSAEEELSGLASDLNNSASEVIILVPADLNDNGQTVVEQLIATTTPDTASTEQNIETTSPEQGNNSEVVIIDEEIIEPEIEVAEIVEGTVETGDDETSENNDPLILPEEVNTENPPVPEADENQETNLNVQPEPAIEPNDMPTDLAPNIEITTL